jgi:uncharacterized protein YebE (UPF0316 family)
MKEFIIRFFTAAPPLELFLILISKVVEVSLGTVRNILINKGYRREGTVLSFFEIILWTFIASRVIMGITEAPIKGIVYSIGFSLGIYFGSRIESYIALGRVLIQAIIAGEQSEGMIGALREKGYVVTHGSPGPGFGKDRADDLRKPQRQGGDHPGNSPAG